MYVDANLESYEDYLQGIWASEAKEVASSCNWSCSWCGTTDPHNLEDTDYRPVCMACGAVQSSMGVRTASALPPQARGAGSTLYQARKKDKDGRVIPGRVCYGTGPRRRYKREFYYRERLAQWTCDEPALKTEIMDRFYCMLWSGSYGCYRFLTKGDVLQMCKDSKLCKCTFIWNSYLTPFRQIQGELEIHPGQT